MKETHEKFSFEKSLQRLEDILEVIEEKRKILDAGTDGKEMKDLEKDFEKIINKFLGEEN